MSNNNNGPGFWRVLEAVGFAGMAAALIWVGSMQATVTRLNDDIQENKATIRTVVAGVSRMSTKLDSLVIELRHLNNRSK